MKTCYILRFSLVSVATVDLGISLDVSRPRTNNSCDMDGSPITDLDLE